jgi:hypothetical protein
MGLSRVSHRKAMKKGNAEMFFLIFFNKAGSLLTPFFLMKTKNVFGPSQLNGLVAELRLPGPI